MKNEPTAANERSASRASWTSGTPACLHARRIEALLAGRLPESQEAELCEHIDRCEVCQVTLRRLAEAVTLGDARPQTRGDEGGGGGDTAADDAPTNEPVGPADSADRAAEAPTASFDAPALDRVMRRLKSFDVAGQDDGRTRPWDELHRATVPDRIGPYRVLEVIGEGGFGVVYHAEQLEPVRRRVALKVIKPGMDSKTVIARFEAERQALAIMEHPTIAKVLDAGLTEQGRPYFVMELIHGVPLQDYCDRHGLSLTERIELFIQVCRGVQHAHQKGIVHRDLKPSNVLVTVLDGKPVPKIIDFGVAKATAQRLTEHTLFTAQGRMIGTPEYMSPEQAEMSGLDVDTRTDVYSLGVMLYELLAGALPFDARTLRSVSLPEIQRIIRDQDPPRPSAKWASLPEARRAELARQRRADARAVARALRHELDWITMKAMDKDRTRRYGGADALADDLRRYLDHLPVEAGPPSAMYRLSRTLRKHRGEVTAAALLLVLAMALVAFGYLRERGLRQRAEMAEQLAVQRADETRRLAYAAQIGDADSDLRAGRIPRVRELLNRCDADLCGWEWHRLWLLAHPAARVIGDGRTPVFDAATDAPGRLLLAGGTGLTLWDPVDGRRLHRFDEPAPLVMTVALSDDGAVAASGGVDGKVRLWDTGSGALRHELDTGVKLIAAVALSGDGSLLAAAGGDGRSAVAHVWRTDDGQRVHKFERAEGSIKALAFGPAGDRLVAAGQKPALVAWSLEQSPPPTHVLSEAAGQMLNAVAFSPTGDELVTGNNHGLVAILDAATGEARVVMNEHEQEVKSVRFNADGSQLVSTSLDGTVRVWDAATGRSLRVLGGEEGFDNAAMFDGEGTHLITAGGAGLRVWPAEPNPQVLRFAAAGHVPNALAFAPGGGALVSAADDGTVRWWPIDDTAAPETLTDGDAPALAVAFSGDGSRLAAAVGPRVYAWAMPSRRPIELRDEHRAPVQALAMAPDGERLVSAAEDGEIRVWSLQRGEVIATMSDHRGRVLTLGVSPDSTRLASGGDDRAPRVWDLSTGELLHRGPEQDAMIILTRWRDADELVIGTLKGRVFGWRPGSDDFAVYAAGSRERRYTQIRLSPDSRRAFASGRSKLIGVWQLATGRELLTLHGHTTPVEALAVSPDGRLLASSDSAGSILVWLSGRR